MHHINIDPRPIVADNVITTRPFLGHATPDALTTTDRLTYPRCFS